MHPTVTKLFTDLGCKVLGGNGSDFFEEALMSHSHKKAILLSTTSLWKIWWCVSIYSFRIFHFHVFKSFHPYLSTHFLRYLLLTLFTVSILPKKFLLHFFGPSKLVPSGLSISSSYLHALLDVFLRLSGHCCPFFSFFISDLFWSWQLAMSMGSTHSSTFLSRFLINVDNFLKFVSEFLLPWFSKESILPEHRFRPFSQSWFW